LSFERLGSFAAWRSRSLKVVGIWEVDGENGMTPVLRPYDVSDHYVKRQSRSLLLLHSVSTIRLISQTWWKLLRMDERR
jgi:hypothetical protein